MATAPTLPIEKEMSVQQQTRAPARSLNPLLIAIMIGLVVFPFLARFLPIPVIQHLEALFH